MSDIYRQQPNIPARNVEGVMAVITPRTSEIHRLNGVATELWERCVDPGATREQLIASLSDRYEVSRDRLEADVDAFLTEATAKGLLLVSR